jgi:hypothetical protein
MTDSARSEGSPFRGSLFDPSRPKLGHRPLLFGRIVFPGFELRFKSETEVVISVCLAIGPTTGRVFNYTEQTDKVSWFLDRFYDSPEHMLYEYFGYVWQDYEPNFHKMTVKPTPKMNLPPKITLTLEELLK